MSETKVQLNYKDSIFRMLFKDKENLLSLYNALIYCRKESLTRTCMVQN